MNVALQTNMQGKAIFELISEALETQRNVRRADRYPFFRAVSIRTPDGQHFSAFSRDISSMGIGLLHNFEMPCGDVEISISRDQGYCVPVRARIAWCRPCTEGWFLSGGEFIGILPPA